MTAHKHAALMLQYAQDAAETDKPWERWEVRIAADVQPNAVFEMLYSHPKWYTNNEYRRKPQVIRVGRHEFPKPINFTPKIDTIYWIIRLQAKGYAPDDLIWRGDAMDASLLANHMIHLSREAAQAHADVLNAICRGDVE